MLENANMLLDDIQLFGAKSPDMNTEQASFIRLDLGERVPWQDNNRSAAWIPLHTLAAEKL